MPRREVRIALGGARGPRPPGCGGRMGRTGSFAPTRFVRDVGDAVPYTPCHCEPVRAAKQVPLGYRLARQSVFPQRKGRIPTPVTRSLARNDSAARPPLDKPVGMGIIIDVRGRCDKRSAPQQLNDYFELFSSQKPSPCRVAVSAFQSLDSYRDRMTQNMNRENEKHVCHPLSGP